MSNKLLVVIGGPTGVGKTDMAIRLAQHYKTEIVSADSRQVYSELNIGVGRPPDAQLNAVPHHLIGHISIHQDYSVAHYTKEALQILDKLFRSHDIVILTGGTGLYVKALMEGFDDIPEVKEGITERWTSLWKQQGIDVLLKSLQELDPEYMDIVDKANARRIIRALAVSESSGKPFSSFLKGEPVKRPFNILPIVLTLPREELYARIDQRVLHMIDQGWEAEARFLYPFRHLKALDTVGYKELFDYFDGNRSLPEAITAIQQSTRRYAKRQMTWWRHQGSWHSYSPNDDLSIIKAIDLELEARSKSERSGDPT
jgi:tRNA dimethylallyltransferase